MSGKVFLVGAGPGDPRLLTLRGAEVLRAADVVVHDRLVAPALLDLAPARAERVDVGKAPGRPRPTQDAINRLLVSRAREGKVVVRLKGGDPFVFGRGGEEALACARAGVPFEVVPGVSSVVAAPAYLGVPLTHRGLSSSVGVATAVAAGGEPVDLRALAGAAETLVVLMVAGRLGQVCEGLVRAGRPPGEPAAVVQWATTSRQRSVVATLGELPALAEEWGVGPPATLVVGPVVALAKPLAWFEHDRRSSPADASPARGRHPGLARANDAVNRVRAGGRRWRP
ncbi:MAG TPA: uroporphyrinogen-III C-methyltransferase [Actinomycetota bacterium]|nr:uroporphyrinogen-III C-methyltransferase [Actinomycetota bacterium]